MTNIPLRSLKLPGNENVYGIGGEYEVSNIDELKKVMKNALPGSVIKLAPGSYSQLNIHNINDYQENLTIQGTTDITGSKEDVNNPEKSAIIEGVSITSGILGSNIFKEGSSNINNAIFPKGLTFKNITFTKRFSQRNSRIDNLTIKDCVFCGTSVAIWPERFNDPYGNDRGTGDSSDYRLPHAHLKQKNFSITGCKFWQIDSKYLPDSSDYNGGIDVIGVHNVIIDNNHLENNLDGTAGEIYNGIQVGGHQSSPYFIWSSGDILVTSNHIQARCKSNAINVHSINVGAITVANNDIVQEETPKKPEAIIIRNSRHASVELYINDGVGKDPEQGYFNTWKKGESETQPISSGNGITITNILMPITVQPTVSYNSSTDIDESNLDKWLESVFKSLPDNSYTDVSIRCPGIKDTNTLIGKLYKQGESGVVDTVDNLSGNHFTKIRDWRLNNGTWNKTKYPPEQTLVGLINTTNDIKEDMTIAVFDENSLDGITLPLDIFMEWLNAFLDEMTIGGSKLIHIESKAVFGAYDFPFETIVATLYKLDNVNNARLSGTATLKDYPTISIPVSVEKENGMWTSFNYSTDNIIIEQGISGGWTYRKWYSGIAECWGIFIYPNHLHYSIDSATSWYNHTGNKELPFTFSAPPCFNYIVKGGTGSAYPMAAYCDNNSVTWHANSNVDNADFTVHFQVVGRWK